MDKNETIKAFGLPARDIFELSVSQISTSRRVTKRTVLSDMLQVFDSLGLIIQSLLASNFSFRVCASYTSIGMNLFLLKSTRPGFII